MHKTYNGTANGICTACDGDCVWCGENPSEADIYAIVEARAGMAKTSLVAPAAAPLPTYTPAPTPAPEVVVNEVPIEKIVEVVVRAAPLATYIPLPTYTHVPGPALVVVVKEVTVVVVTATTRDRRPG